MKISFLSPQLQFPCRDSSPAEHLSQNTPPAARLPSSLCNIAQWSQHLPPTSHVVPGQADLSCPPWATPTVLSVLFPPHIRLPPGARNYDLPMSPPLKEGAALCTPGHGRPTVGAHCGPVPSICNTPEVTALCLAFPFHLPCPFFPQVTPPQAFGPRGTSDPLAQWSPRQGTLYTRLSYLQLPWARAHLTSSGVPTPSTSGGLCLSVSREGMETLQLGRFLLTTQGPRPTRLPGPSLPSLHSQQCACKGQQRIPREELGSSRLRTVRPASWTQPGVCKWPGHSSSTNGASCLDRAGTISD